MEGSSNCRDWILNAGFFISEIRNDYPRVSGAIDG